MRPKCGFCFGEVLKTVIRAVKRSSELLFSQKFTSSNDFFKSKLILLLNTF